MSRVVHSISRPSARRTRAGKATATRMVRRICCDSQATATAAPRMTALYTVQNMFSSTVSSSCVLKYMNRATPKQKAVTFSPSRMR